jgi:hypothetical protein
MESTILKHCVAEAIGCFAEAITLGNTLYALAHKPFGKAQEEKD